LGSDYVPHGVAAYKMIALHVTKSPSFGAAYLWFGPLLFKVLETAPSHKPKYLFAIEFKVFINIRRSFKKII